MTRQAADPALPDGPSACLISLSPIADDPRVRRHGDALAQAGWRVSAVGLEARFAPPPAWPVTALASSRLGGRWYRALRLAACRVDLERGFWLDRIARDIRRAARRHGAALFVANDWPVLPIAADLASRIPGARFIYDTHEYAAAERPDSVAWRTLVAPVARAVERRYAPRAARVMTVCEGIAELLHHELDLPRRPLVVRNVPPYRAVALRPTSTPIRVLYHGLFNADRGLENVVRSVAEWRDEFVLVLRGFGPPAFVERLRALARRHRVTARVEFAPPVAQQALVPLASEADVGLFVMEPLGPHHRNVLPNKLFEYLMAGLAVLVSDLPELRRVIDAHGVGRLVPSVEPAAIAGAVNGLHPEAINAYKRRALEAARTLCWEREAPALVAACRDALAPPAGP